MSFEGELNKEGVHLNFYVSYRGEFLFSKFFQTLVPYSLSFKMVNTQSNRAKNIDAKVENFQKELVHKVMARFNRSVKKVMKRYTRSTRKLQRFH